MEKDRIEYCLAIDIKCSNNQTKMLSIRGFFTDDDVDNFTQKVEKAYDEIIFKKKFPYDPRQGYDAHSPEDALIVLKINQDD